MRSRALQFVVPGDLSSATGGYVYDRQLIAGLQALGWEVTVHSLDASFPDPTADALARAHQVFVSLADDALVLVDGLALGAMPQVVEAHRDRLAIVALIHQPLGSRIETEPALAERLRQCEARALRCVRHTIVTSQRSARALAGAIVPAQCLSIMEPGTEPVAQARSRDTHGGPLQLLCVATLSAGKGHELLIDALAPLASLSWHLRCVGSLTRCPATVQRLQAQLQRLGLTERVELTGEIAHQQMADVYDCADLFVLATLSETYCMAVAEALAHGLPVISTRTGAIPELVGTMAGLLADPGDGRALHVALSRALQDPQLRASLARGAVSARERLARWPQVCARVAALLDAVGSASGTYCYSTR